MFHSLMVEGKKELKYSVVREYIVRMLCALRRLYEDWVSTVGGIKEQRNKGDRLLNIYKEAKACVFYVFIPNFPIRLLHTERVKRQVSLLLRLSSLSLTVSYLIQVSHNMYNCPK